MLLDVNGNILSSPIDEAPIRDSWDEYINFTKNTHLYNFTKEELRKRISAVKNERKSIINTTVLIGRFLHELSVNENFNQQFRSVFPRIDRGLVLAIQLFLLLHEDDERWTFLKPETDEAILTKASYIISFE